MRSTGGEKEFWKSLKVNPTAETICDRFRIIKPDSLEFERLLNEAQRNYRFGFVPETLMDTTDAEYEWTREDFVAAGRLAKDLLKKVELVSAFYEKRSARPRDLLNDITDEWLTLRSGRPSGQIEFNGMGDPIGIHPKMSARQPGVSEYLLQLQYALEQADAQLGLYRVQTIEHWETSVWPIYLFARDRLNMHPSATFGEAYDPPDEVKKAWKLKISGKRLYYPIPTARIQEFLFECMRAIDGHRARPTTLRSMMTYWSQPVVREGEPSPKLIRRKKRTAILKKRA